MQATGRLKCLTRQTRSNESDSDSSDSDSDLAFADEDLQEIVENLRTDAQCLLDLGARFDEPALGIATTPERPLLPAQAKTWEPTLNFVERIQWRYPKCDEELSIRLGKVNWARVVKCHEVKSRQQREKLQEAWTTVPEASTTLHDSGIGTSIPSNPSLPPPTQYAETTLSYHTGHGGSVRVPPMPETAKQGVPFECVACGGMVSIKTKSAWK